MIFLRMELTTPIYYLMLAISKKNALFYKQISNSTTLYYIKSYYFGLKKDYATFKQS